MRLARFFLKAANFALSAAVFLSFLVIGAFSVYALWDNAQIYAAVDDVQASLLAFKPPADDGTGADAAASFAELKKINPDVCAWLMLDNTAIDYPIVQGADNLSYINTDVYGNFALSGSIFLDSDCDSAFRTAYSLLYGHHMDNSKMFGDLDLYKDERFFRENRSGVLILPDRTYRLDLFACLLLPASENAIFAPTQWAENIDGLLEFVPDHALFFEPDVLDALSSEESPQILAMSTCSSEFTDARTVVLAAMRPLSE